MGTLPMFPLGSVLLPGAFLPLQVFEPRYQLLVRDCMEGSPEFGVALIERGSEVGGGDSRFDVGCVARIVEVGALPGGRIALATVGDRRIRVGAWLPDDPYPRAEVADWPDPAPIGGEADLRDSAVADLRRVLALAAELGERTPELGSVEVAADVVTASYQLAALAPVGPLDRLALLAAPSVADRLALVSSLLADVELLLASGFGGG